MIVLTSLVAFSTISFLFFGISCFTTNYMRTEFVRYGLGDKQRLIGFLQILGAIGLLIGYLYLPTLSIISAIGLSLLMILGFGVRLKIKDTFIQSAPSLFYAIINAWIAILLLRGL
ncbi:MAG: DoxX family protein [Eudoraea sp.]|uniref:DoxX family protein n=2 Tax=Eudoraea sp. TaxID=1979955 RepID=UPI003C739121